MELTCESFCSTKPCAGANEGLTPAPAKIFCAAIATSARFRHPTLTAKFLEALGLAPNPFQRTVTDVFELQPGNNGCGVAGQSLAAWVDQQLTASPSAHAGFRKSGIVVGHDCINANLSRESFLGGSDCFQRFEHLFPGG